MFNQANHTPNDLRSCAPSIIAEMVRQGGTNRIDPEQLQALKQARRAYVLSCAQPPFDPATVTADRLLMEDLQASDSGLAALKSRRAVVRTRLTNALEFTTSLPAPCRSLLLIKVSATAVFSVCFSTTLYGSFFATLADPVIGWFVAIVTGTGVGGFLCLLLLNGEEESQ